MKADIQYQFHHIGIPSQQTRSDEKFSEKMGLYTADNPGKFRIQWHRFAANSPLHPLIQQVPHVAFKVDNLQAAIAGETVILGPYEPIDDYFVAMIDDQGVPIELIETQLTDEEIWARAKAGKGEIYR